MRRTSAWAMPMLSVMGVAFCVSTRSAHAATALESRVKAAYINNFIKFTEWPKKALSEKNGSIVVGFLGGEDVRKAFEKYVKGRKVKGKPVVTRRSSKVEDLLPCHLLFIESGDKEQALKSAANSSTLTVSEARGFAKQGGMLGLILVDGKVRFEYNEAAVKKAGLNIQSTILRLGKKVE